MFNTENSLIFTVILYHHPDNLLMVITSLNFNDMKLRMVLRNQSRFQFIS